MDINKAFADLRDGKLPDYDVANLRSMSAGCVVFIQNSFPDAVHLKAAIDDEIRRKEMQHSTARLMQQTEMLVQHSEKLTKQTDGLLHYTLELTRLTKGVLWFTIVLGVLALVQIVIMALEYFGKAH